jgi:hypothetical protein
MPALPLRQLTGLLAAAAVLGCALATARADEGESAFSVGLGYAGISIPDHTANGGDLSLEYERGVTDVVWLRASLGGGLLLDAGSRVESGHGTVGLTYVLDVLRYVPYVTLGAGAIYLRGSSVEEDLSDPVQPLIQLGGGLDVLVDRELSYGVYARFESYLTRTAFFSVGARVSWRWGFF